LAFLLSPDFGRLGALEQFVAVLGNEV